MRGLTTLILSALLVVVSSARARATAGTLDPTCSGDGIQTAFKTGSLANAVGIHHAGRTVVVGQTTDDHVDVAVARFRPDGSSDPSFGGDGRMRIPLGTAAVAFDVAITGNDGLAIAGRRTKGTSEDSFV